MAFAIYLRPAASTAAIAVLLAAAAFVPHASAGGAVPAVIAEGSGWLTIDQPGGPCSESVAIQVTYTPAGATSFESYVVALTPTAASLCRVGTSGYPLTIYTHQALVGSPVACTHASNYDDVECDYLGWISWSIDKFGNFDFHDHATSGPDVDATGTLVRLS